jgi:hypothetical protein
MWFKLTRNDIGYQWILMQGASHDASNYIPFYIEQNSQLSTVLTVTDYTWTGYIPYGIPTGNVWHHVVLTIGSGVVSGYLDGVLKGTTTYSGTIISMGDSHTLGFYRSGPGAFSPTEVSTPAQIFIDELGIWNRVLSSSEVSSLYNNGDGIPFTISSAPTLSPTLSPTKTPTKTPTKSDHHHPKPKPKPNKNGYFESKRYQWWQGAKRYVGYQWQTHNPTKPRKDD